MAVTAHKYGNAVLAAFAKQVDWEGDDIRAMLVTSSYTPNQDTHTHLNDVRANEAAGTGYTADGETIANRSASYDGASNKATLDGDNVSWPNSTITARYAVVYNNTPSADADKPLLGYVDFGQDESSSNGTFEIQWNVAGIFEIDVE